MSNNIEKSETTGRKTFSLSLNEVQHKAYAASRYGTPVTGNKAFIEDLLAGNVERLTVEGEEGFGRRSKTFHMSQEDFDSIKALAENEGIAASALVRQELFGVEPVKRGTSDFKNYSIKLAGAHLDAYAASDYGVPGGSSKFIQDLLDGTLEQLAVEEESETEASHKTLRMTPEGFNDLEVKAEKENIHISALIRREAFGVAPKTLAPKTRITINLTQEAASDLAEAAKASGVKPAAKAAELLMTSIAA